MLLTHRRDALSLAYPTRFFAIQTFNFTKTQFRREIRREGLASCTAIFSNLNPHHRPKCPSPHPAPPPPPPPEAGAAKPVKRNKQTPQETIDEFWSKFTTKKPGKAMTVIPANNDTDIVAKKNKKIEAKNTQASYEDAAAMCRAAALTKNIGTRPISTSRPTSRVAPAIVSRRFPTSRMMMTVGMTSNRRVSRELRTFSITLAFTSTAQLRTM